MAIDTHAKKLDFLHKIAKLGMQHFDAGGVIDQLPGGHGITGLTNNPSQALNPANTISQAASGIGGAATGLAGDLTAQDTYNAESPTSAGTIAGQQAGLAGELGTEAAGGGPNPAQIQYEQNAQNIASNAATNYATNRALNPGLAARMAGNTAADTTSKAASGAAQQQAEQQIAAQQQLQGLTGQEQQGLESAQGINAQTAGLNANNTNTTLGGILSGGGSAISSLFAEGGEVDNSSPVLTVPSAEVSNPPNTAPLGQQAAKSSGSSGGGSGGAGAASLIALLADGGTMEPHMQHMAKLYHGQKMAPLSLMKKGGQVKAQSKEEKATVKGDSYNNDKVPALLSQGELVIDRDTMADPGPAGQMARALKQHLEAKNGKKRK